MEDDYQQILSLAELSRTDEVLERLLTIYSGAKANALFRFWELLCLEGDRYVRNMYSRRTYYHYKAQLKVARVGVQGNDAEEVKERKDDIINRQRYLLSHLDNYGEHLRACYGDLYVRKLQRDCGLPEPPASSDLQEKSS